MNEQIDYCGDEEVIQEVLGNDVRFTEVIIDEPIKDTATELELYKDYVAIEMIEQKEDFDNFSDWREKNKELLS